jgi:hypothetical protein
MRLIETDPRIARLWQRPFDRPELLHGSDNEKCVWYVMTTVRMAISELNFVEWEDYPSLPDLIEQVLIRAKNGKLDRELYEKIYFFKEAFGNQKQNGRFVKSRECTGISLIGGSPGEMRGTHGSPVASSPHEETGSEPDALSNSREST